ncbi:MAG: hypothetical protein RBT65_16995 [Methanolobus sp.]|nr:hypothetical protein [Methanolobus sp.]
MDYNDIIDDRPEILFPNEVTIAEILLPTPEILMTTDTLEGKEEEYSYYIGTLEHTIATYYYFQDKKLTDKKVIKILKHLRSNLDKTHDFYEDALELELFKKIVDVICDEPITTHEFLLVIDYILMSIDNRLWIPDNRAYLKWICYFFGLNSPEDDLKQENTIKNLARKCNIPDDMISSLLVRNEPDDKDIEEDDIDPFDFLDAEDKKRIEDFISMSDEERVNYLVHDSPLNFDLFGVYILELEGKGDIKALKSMAKRFSKNFGDDFFLYSNVADIVFYCQPNIAKIYLDKALNALEKTVDLSEDEKIEIREDLKNNIRACDKIHEALNVT